MHTGEVCSYIVRVQCCFKSTVQRPYGQLGAVIYLSICIHIYILIRGTFVESARNLTPKKSRGGFKAYRHMETILDRTLPLDTWRPYSIVLYPWTHGDHTRSCFTLGHMETILDRALPLDTWRPYSIVLYPWLSRASARSCCAPPSLL